MTTVRIMTPPAPGAIAILQIEGDLDRLLTELSERNWTPGTARLVAPGDIDDCLAVRLDATTAQLMPHGGPRVQQRLLDWLARIEVHPADDPVGAWPEASDELEAAMLSTISTAASPLAVDLLLAQPKRWAKADGWTDEDEQRSHRLNRLLHPPRVVMTGAPNVGKSTLLNTLAGRDRAITSDTPGTTRDFVSAEVDCCGLAVHWFDTPGLRPTDDPIEEEAMHLARRLLDEADLLISAADADTDWPELPCTPHLRVGTKADLKPRPDADVLVSAMTGDGMAELVQAVCDALVPPADRSSNRPWRFDRTLPHPC